MSSVLDEDEDRDYVEDNITQLQDSFPDASFMVYNFREEGRSRSWLSDLLSSHDMTVLDYPRQYEGCPLLTMEVMNHALKSGENWLSTEGQRNVLLMHCERGGWAVLAFMLAALLLYRKQYSDEQKALEMIYNQAPRGLIQLLSPLNPMPSQMRYLHYISRRNVGSEWPPGARPIALDCVILRSVPAGFSGEGECRLLVRNGNAKLFSSTPKELYKKADCELIKINIDCNIQGDVVLECMSVDEEIMFRVMFNTAFISSNILMLNRDEIDIMWDAKDGFPQEFRAEVIVSEMDSANQLDPNEVAGLSSSLAHPTSRPTPPPPLPPPPPPPPKFSRLPPPPKFSSVTSSALPLPPPPPPAPVTGYCSRRENIIASNLKKAARLTIRELQEITENFSDKRKIGQGAYGRVYVGMLENGEEIAVKMLYDGMPGIDDEKFIREFENLVMLEHQNIVRLVGFCYETQHEPMQYMGRTIFAEKIYRALCFEYMQNGSLQKHISDERDGLTWHKRFKIIRGTCEGLKYLHKGFKEPVYHLDLKPDNILLDKDMVPKLADFGMSRLFGDQQTRITQGPIGTFGYLPREYLHANTVSNKLDIFSLGVVMINIIAGTEGRSTSDDMPRQEFLDLVHANWRNRLQKTFTSSWTVDAYCQQVNRCTEIALSCVETDRHNRPTIADIVRQLNDIADVLDEEREGLQCCAVQGREVKLSLVGLQNAGKTSLVHSIATGGYKEDMIPTVGFNMWKATKGNVTIKFWDLGGRQTFRTMWERYCCGVSAILYVVDAADRDSIPTAKSELHDLLTKQSLAGIPILILGNKIDKSEALSKPALVDQLGLESITGREVCCYMISCKDSVNIEGVIDWLIKHSKTEN